MTLRVRFPPNAAAMRRLAGRIALPLALAVLAACSGGGNGGGSGNNAQSSPTLSSPTLSSVAISPSNPSVNFGDSATLSATARFSDGSTQVITNSSDIAWSSSDPSIAQVRPASAGSASVTTIARGKATVVAQYKGKPGTTFVTVVPVLSGVAITPDPLDVPPEFSGNLSAIARFNDGVGEDVTEQAVWRSSDIALATVSDLPGSKGLITGIKSGKPTITAQYAGFAGSISANVVPTLLVGTSGLVFPPPNGILLQPEVSMDALGHAHGAWIYQDSGEVFYAGHDGTNWTDRIQVNSNQSPKDLAFNHHIVTNAAGARLIVWSGLNALYAVYAVPGQGFGAVQTIWPNPASPSEVGNAEAVVTSNGDAFVIWPAQNTMLISRYNSVAALWEQPTALSVLPRISRAAFNNNGDAIFVWSTSDSATNDVTLNAAVYLNDPSGATLQPANPLYLSLTGAGVLTVDAAINDNRDVVVAWSDDHFLGHVAQYSTNQGWYTNRDLPMGDALMVSFPVRVAMNQSNYIFVAWADIQGQRPYASRFTPTGGWETGEVLSTAFGRGSSKVNAVAVADSGNAICIFVDAESFASKEFKYRRFLVGQGWGSMSTLNDPGLVGEPNESLRAAYNGNGQGVMAWQEASAVPDGSGGLISIGFNFMELAPSIE